MPMIILRDTKWSLTDKQIKSVIKVLNNEENQKAIKQWLTLLPNQKEFK